MRLIMIHFRGCDYPNRKELLKYYNPYGISYECLNKRIQNGMNLDKVIETSKDVRNKTKLYHHNGEYDTLENLVEKYNPSISISTARTKLRDKVSLDDILDNKTKSQRSFDFNGKPYTIKEFIRLFAPNSDEKFIRNQVNRKGSLNNIKLFQNDGINNTHLCYMFYSDSIVEIINHFNLPLKPDKVYQKFLNGEDDIFIPNSVQ